MNSCTACGFDASAAVVARYTLILPRAAVSLNQLKSNTRGNHKYRYARRAWARELRSAPKVPQATAHRRVFFSRLWGKRQRAFDYGNLVGGFKPLLDMLVDAGYLVDDSPKHCSEFYQQHRAPDGISRVIVVLEELE